MKKVNNKFLDLLVLLISLISTTFKSLLLLLGIKKDMEKTYFLYSFNFLWKIWPTYYWKRPTWYKIGTFLKDFLNHIFYNKNEK